MKNNKKIKMYAWGVLLLLMISIICVLVYKAQLRDKLQQPIEYTMMTEHKPTGEVVLSGDSPEFSEVFICKVPDLKKLVLECSVKKAVADTVLIMFLTDVDTGELYYSGEKSLIRFSGGSLKKMQLRLKKGIPDLEGKTLRLTCQLKNAEETEVSFTANQKQAVVSSFNGIEGDRTNVIYTMYYGNNSFLKILYAILCVALLLFTGISYWLLIIRHLTVERFYLPMALMLGLIFQGVITVYGVPDEPLHMDTVYNYSNQMMFVEDTGIPGTIYKRRCDAEMTDMLANGLESNSYYQLLNYTFEEAEQKELILVSYVDTSSFVPDLIFFPAALGVSIGRMAGLSAMLVFQLGRIFSLIAFVMLVWLAIQITPFGKNVFGLLGLLPIALQQGASASYDALLIGIAFLFIALCFHIIERKQREKWKICLIMILAFCLAVTKGGVYLPILGLLFGFLGCNGKKNRKLNRKYFIMLFVVVIALVVGIVLIKYRSIFQVFLTGNVEAEGDNALYTVAYLIQHPMKLIYLYWNTFMKDMDDLLSGLLGGRLSWLDVKMSWSQILFFLGGLVLLANVEEDRYSGSRKYRLFLLVICFISTILIMMSMLIGCTTMKFDYIQGLQGRYFLPFAPILILISENRMIDVKENQCRYIWMTMVLAEFLLVLQVAVMVV